MPPKPLKPVPGEDEDDFEIAQPELAPDDPLRQFLPTSFGRQDVARDLDEVYEKMRRVPAKPLKSAKSSSNSGSDSDSDDDDDDDEYPITHSIVLKTHTKPIASLSLDPSGTRLATASHDTSLKLYDFPSMSFDRMYAFRSMEPCEAHLLHSAQFSPLDSGRHVLVVPAATQAKIYSRDGEEVVELNKGDMYLRDMHNTKGHVSEITAGCWSPFESNVVATAGTDSTIRLWDVDHKRAHKDIMVYKSRTAKGGRSRMCCVAWNPAEGGQKSLLASVALDGTLVVYAGEGPYSRPAMEVRNAHTPETWTGGLAFSGDGRLLVTRGQDEMIKLWDTRKLKAPVTQRASFRAPAAVEGMSLSFSPNSSTLLTGDVDGNLHLLSPATLRTEETIPLSPGAPITCALWHAKLNQILAGSADGSTHILFSPTKSERGAKLVLANAPRKRHIDDDPSMTTDAAAISGDAVILPNALLGSGGGGAGFGGRGGNGGGGAGAPGGAGGGKKLDPRAPYMPQATPWGKSQPDQGHVERSIQLASMRDEDPREALLKYAEKAEKDPMFTGVWKKTQPKTIYAEVDDEEEEPEEGPEKKRFKRR